MLRCCRPYSLPVAGVAGLAVVGRELFSPPLKPSSISFPIFGLPLAQGLCPFQPRPRRRHVSCD